MYGIFAYIWLIFMVNVGKYTIHGSYGHGHLSINTVVGKTSTSFTIPANFQGRTVSLDRDFHPDPWAISQIVSQRG